MRVDGRDWRIYGLWRDGQFLQVPQPLGLANVENSVDAHGAPVQLEHGADSGGAGFQVSVLFPAPA